MQFSETDSIVIAGPTGRVRQLVTAGITELGAHVSDGLAGCRAIVYISDLATAHDPGATGEIGADFQRFDEVCDAVRRPGGPRRLVVVTSAFVYGAHANNPIPLSESAVLRPNESLASAMALGEIERRISKLTREVPDADVTVLRAAPVLDPRADGAPAWLLGITPFRVRNAEAPRQFVHPADLASVIVHSLANDLTGTFNIAPDGWLTPYEVDGLLGTRVRPALPADASRRCAARLTSIGVTKIPPGALDYMQHSIVVSNARLASTGFTFEYGNARVLRVAAGTARRRARNARRPRTRLIAAAVVIAGLLLMRSARRRLGTV